MGEDEKSCGPCVPLLYGSEGAKLPLVLLVLVLVRFFVLLYSFSFFFFLFFLLLLSRFSFLSCLWCCSSWGTAPSGEDDEECR